MFRYRCPHCGQVLQALEMRAGKNTVCSRCSQQLTIPADKAAWLNERGEPLLASPTVLIPMLPPEVTVEPADRDEFDADVLGAILVGDIPLTTGPASVDLHLATMAEPEPRPVPKPWMPAPTDQPQARPAAPLSEIAERPPPEPVPAFYRSMPTEPAAPPIPPPSVRANAAPAELRTPSRPTTRAVVKAAAGSDDPSWDANNGRGAQRSGRMVPATSPPAASRRAEEPEAVSFNDTPLHLRTSVDVAADLTAALTSRMKPAPKPPRDLNPSTALWLVATGIALALLILTLVTANTFAPAVFLFGLAEVAAGYIWVVWLAFRRDWQRGVACAVPPVTLWYLTRHKYARYRPLRFVVTGVVLVALAGAAGFALPHTRAWAGAYDAIPLPAAPEDIAAKPKLEQLRHYHEQRAFEALTDLLRMLARTDPLYSEDAKSRAEIADELKILCNHPDVKVKVEALAAYALWGGADARGLCLAATRSANRDERMMALKLLVKWKDAEVARAVAERVGSLSDTETQAARDTLEKIGAPAERAVFPLLRAKEQSTRLIAIEILASDTVGGPDSVAELRTLADLPDPTGHPADPWRASDDPVTRQKAAGAAQAIQRRLASPKK